MRTFDPYCINNKLDAPILDSIVICLEARGNNRDFQKMMADYLDAINIDSAVSVLGT